MNNSKKVALVLSSGGARGLAHIGVIERLEEEGFEITSIAGSSMGAVIGAFYAAGQLDIYKKWVLRLDKLDVFNLFDFTLSTRGIIKGDKLFKILQEIIEDRLIENLRIPFVAIATDIYNKKEIAFTEGSMYEAIRASSAIPTVLRPYQWNDLELIDGGVVNPLPIDKVMRHNGDNLIAVNVNANMPKRKLKEKQIKAILDAKKKNDSLLNRFLARWQKVERTPESEKMGFFDIINHSLELVQDQLCQSILEKHPPYLLVEISNDACGTFEFYNAKALIKLGREAFDEEYKELMDSMHSEK
jgi:NTE family protein